MDRIITYMDLTNLIIPNANEVAEEILSLPESEWFWVKFHGAWMCSLYNERHDVGWLKQHCYNEHLPKDSAAKIALQDYIFPYLGGPGNVTVIKTCPGQRLNDHVDCSPEEIGTMEHKFRWVVKGEKENALYFFNQNNEKIFYSPKTDAYVLNGAHPHGMINRGDNTKLTVCVGSPWSPNKIYFDNIRDLDYTTIQIPKKINPEWNDPRFNNDNKIGLGITEFKNETR